MASAGNNDEWEQRVDLHPDGVLFQQITQQSVWNGRRACLLEHSSNSTRSGTVANAGTATVTETDAITDIASQQLLQGQDVSRARI